MEDYAGNSKKNREVPALPKKEIHPVVTGEVLVKKKTLGIKFKELFIEADLKSVNRYIVYDVLLPAIRNTIVDAATKGIERMMYGESAIRRRNYGPMASPRITYNSPVNRGYTSTPISRPYSRVPTDLHEQRYNREEFILSSREEAETVLTQMNEIIDTYEVVSVGDLNELLGRPSSHVDNKWGWIYLGDARIQQIREGYLLNLPQAEPMQAI
jgi:hypothetical protein